MLLRLLQLAPRIRVLIAAATRDEKGRRAGVSLLEIALGVAGVIATDLVEVLAEGRVVTGIAEENGAQLAIRAVDAEDGHLMVYGPVRVGIDAIAPVAEEATVHSETALGV